MAYRKIPSLTAEEMLEIMNKQWASTKDIQALASVGEQKALKIKNEINEILEQDGYIAIGKVPMEKLVEYLKININYLKKISKWLKVDSNFNSKGQWANGKVERRKGEKADNQKRETNTINREHNQ